MYSRDPFVRRPGFGGLGAGFGRPPRDVLVLLGVVFLTFSLRFFDSTSILPLLMQLSSAVWEQAYLWQLLTYPLVGYGEPSGFGGIWFLLQLWILFMFAGDVYSTLGRRHFWKLLAWATGGGGVVAVLVELVAVLVAGRVSELDFVLIQGQHMLLIITVAAFATLHRDATIYFFFVLPIKARWFLAIEILMGFMGFLSTRDLAGFLGLCAAVGITYVFLTPAGARRLLHEAWLRFERWRIQIKLARIRKKTGMHVVKDDEPGKGDPWVNYAPSHNAPSQGC